ncbi:amino acid ABC transporter permease [Kineosporia sp. J2-2]|uniref:Amino acid ABC transporter permease n=1 Tax=Kineosporia corallincola TaxID=2835133 RepID=A0ABS5TII5_9ACTN|nr:amino acid ABC transporter permease [Kineosporia corallincola]MBT0769888.1 amino acid ABC transporter permease [Kineosporia corallincola]
MTPTETGTEVTTAAGRPPASSVVKVVPVRRYGQWITTVVLLAGAALVVRSLVTNPRFQWDIAFGYFFNEQVLDGLVTTIWLTVVAMLAGITMGVVMAVGRRSDNPVVSGAAALYIGFFRGTPLLVQLIFWFNLAALYPVLSIGIPSGPTFAFGSANVLITPTVAAILGLGLNEGAYMSEIVRAGLQSVDPGQTQAAQALGLRRGQVFRRIVFPQAMRVIIPPTGNETIAMLKTTSLVSVIAIPEILFQVQAIYSRTYQVIPLLITVSLWYLILTTVLTIGQVYLERRFRRGDLRTPQRSFRAVFLGRREPGRMEQR